MKQIYIFNQSDLDLFLSCLKINKWNSNAGTSFRGHSDIVLKYKKKKCIFESNDEDTPIIMPADTLMKCIDTFMQVIWQEMKGSHQSSL